MKMCNYTISINYILNKLNYSNKFDNIYIGT